MRVEMILGVAVSILTALNPLSAKGSDRMNQAGEHETILIRQDTTDEIGAPRTSVFNPFFAELMNGYVILGSFSSFGPVHVTITSTAGDNYTTSFDTEDGAIVLPISGDSGFYSLRITIPGGLQFVGEFTI